MSAVMVETDLEPHGLGHELLLEWAPWARDDNEGERKSWAVRPRVDHGYHGDPPDRFFIVDKIVAPHRVQKDSYWKCVSAYYLGERCALEIASGMPGWSERAVLANIIGFGALVEREFRDYTDARRVVITRAR